MARESAISSRLLGFLGAAGRGSDANSVVRAVASEFRASAVYLQALSVDRLLVPIAWHAHQTKLRYALQHAANSGNLEFARQVPEQLDVPVPIWPSGGGAPAGSPLESLPVDAWIEGVSLRSSDEELQGVLIIVGAASAGCDVLSEEERTVLANSCALTLAAASEMRRAERLEGQLQFLTKISTGLASRKTIFERLKSAVAAAQGVTGFDSIQLLTWDPTGHKLLLNVLYTRDSGFMPDTTWDRMTREEILDSSRRFLEDSTPMIIADPAELDSVPPQHRRWMLDNGIRFLVFVPLIFEGEHLGTLVITSHYSRERTEDRIRALTALGGHLAAILQLSLLLAEVEESYQRLRMSHRRTIETLALAAEMRDATTGQHLKNLEKLSTAVGKKIGLSGEDLQNLAFGAFVHDIGKLHVPDAVLLKAGKLDAEDRTLMRTHPEAGERILMQSDVPEPVCQMVRWHHERWDGQGYPDGLVGVAIPLPVQIITVVDVFDALTSRRPYKEAWSLEQALEEIRRNRESQFSPIAADAFLDIIPALWKETPAELRAAA
jgi:response regulator RpfG family c-di-GMP phosphodiesterase